MAVTKEYRAYALEKLGQVTPVTDRSMFGGVGLYSGSLFFALLDNDKLYLKVDDSNRADFEARGLGPFMPFGDASHVMNYYPLPDGVLEDPDELSVWVDKAVAVAERKSKKKGRK
jgi:DNA transformation protein and related proteins